MKFEKTNNANMSSLKGEIPITYAELVEVFGKPNYGPNNYDMDKTTCEWILKFEDGTISTIYDYKTSRTPMGEYDWHIGGYDENSYNRVVDCITTHRDKLVKMIRDYETAK